MDGNRSGKNCTVSWRALDAAVRRFDTLNGSANFYDINSKTSASFDTANDIPRLTWDQVRARLEKRFVCAAEVKAEDIEGGKSGARMVVRALRRTAGFADAKEVLECSVWLAALLGAVSNAALDIAESQRRSPSVSPTPNPHDFFATRNSRTATPTPTPALEPGPSGENKKPFFAAVTPTPQSVPAKRRASQALDLDLEPVPLPLGGKGKGKARAIVLDDEDDDIVFVSVLGRRSRSPPPGYLAGLDRSITPPAGRAEAFDDQEYLPEKKGKAAKSPEKTGKRAKKGEPDPSQPNLHGFWPSTHKQDIPQPVHKRS
ncbi:hypothetical protein NBRC10512_001882 [Rhodotorula toruloides]